MSRDKQIEEMARDIFAPKVAIDGIDIAFAAVHGADKPDSHFMRIAQHLYNAGYRKSSDVAREIMQEVRQTLLNMVFANSMGENYDIEKRFAEIEKKYTEEEK